MKLREIAKLNKEIVKDASDELGIPEDKIPVLVEKMLNNEKSKNMLLKTIGEFFGRRSLLEAGIAGFGAALGLAGVAGATTKITDQNVIIDDEWYLKAPAPFSVLVGVEGSKVIAYDYRGRVITDGESGVDDASVINIALSSLTSGRTWKETVLLKGNFTINSSIDIPSYTKLVINGTLTRNGTGFHLIQSTSTNHIDIIGGIIQSQNKFGETYDTNEINLTNMSHCSIKDVKIFNAGEDAIRVSDSKNIVITDCYVYNPLRHGIILYGSTSDAIVTKNIVDTVGLYEGIIVFGTGTNIIIAENVASNASNVAASGAGILVEYLSGGNGFVNVVGNEVYSCAVGIKTYGASGTVLRVNISDNQIYSTTEAGIKLNNVHYSSICNNILRSCKTDGILIKHLTNSVVSSNVIYDSDKGIRHDNTGPLNLCEISSNIIASMTNYGLETLEASLCVFRGNIIAYCNQHGMYHLRLTRSVISNNYFYKNSQELDNTYDDLRIEGDATLDAFMILVANNYFRASGTPRTRYAIGLSTTDISYLLVENNVFDGPYAFINWTPPNSYVRYNLGYTTKNSGTATITAGLTSVTVSHGLVSTPSKVIVTPIGDPGDRFWVDNIGATSFDIFIATAQAADKTFHWEAEV